MSLNDDERTALLRDIEEILVGIDRDECDGPQGGWWPTSAGAVFGAERLRLIRERIILGHVPVGGAATAGHR